MDNVPPYVVQVNPPNGVTNAGINASVSVAFSEPMNASTVHDASLHLTTSRGPGCRPGGEGKLDPLPVHSG